VVKSPVRQPVISKKTERPAAVPFLDAH